MTNLSDTLAALSEAATQGPIRANAMGGSSTLLTEQRPARNDTRIPPYAYREEHCLAYPFLDEAGIARKDFVCFSHGDAAFIAALWNAYRTGQLAPVPSVERVALALINHDQRKLDLPMVESLDDLRFEADKREEIARATAVITAMQEGRAMDDTRKALTQAYTQTRHRIGSPEE